MTNSTVLSIYIYLYVIIECVRSGLLVRIFIQRYYNFSMISNFFRKSTEPALGSNFFLAASFALSSAAVMLRLRPLLPVVVVGLMPLDDGAGGEDGADDEVPLVRDVVVVIVGDTIGTVGTVGTVGATIGTVGATIGFGDAGGDADEEVTDGRILVTGSASSGGGRDFGSSGICSSVVDVEEMITFDTVETTSSLISVTSLVENEAVLTYELLLKRWPWFFGLVENVEVFEEATVTGCVTDSLLILIAIISSLFAVALVATGELGVATTTRSGSSWPFSRFSDVWLDVSFGVDGVDGS